MLEGSWFNGREPDEQRYDLDLAAPDSGSGRLTLAFGENLSVQGSYGYLASPELLAPGVSVQRITGSATWNEPIHGGNWASTAAWGRNIEEAAPTTDSVQVETDADIQGPLVLSGRLSRDVKTASELVITTLPEDDTFALYTADLGVTAMLPIGDHVDAGLGVRGTASLIPATLEPTYGTRTPTGVYVYVQVRPPPMSMDDMASMPMGR
jgi:hypothetical protein